MNRSKTINNIFAASLAALVLFSATSCDKDYENAPSEARNGGVSAISNKEDQQAISSMRNRLPDLGIYNSTMDKVVVFTAKSQYKSFSFSDPNPSWNFSNSDQVYFAPAPQGGGILFIGPGSLGNNTGGSVVAGNTTLDINYTFCFSASDEALGLDFGVGGPNFDGLSVVMGIAGDFEALTTGEFDEDEDLSDIFQGFAVYIVYDNEASGNYPILNWFEDLDTEDEDDLEGNGFAYVLAFQDPGGLYFSKSGNLNVSGGSIGFDGVYWGITGNLFEDWFDDDNDIEFVEVDGFGVMGCS